MSVSVSVCVSAELSADFCSLYNAYSVSSQVPCHLLRRCVCVYVKVDMCVYVCVCVSVCVWCV